MMKELHTFGWYAARISPLLPEEAFRPVPLRLLGGLVHLLISISGLLVIGLFELHLLVKLAIAVVLGTSFASLGFLGHEILHGTVVRRPWLRDLLGAIAFWPLSTGPSLWRKWHNLTHHVFTQHEENDPDAWPSIQKLAKTPLVGWLYRHLPLLFRSIVGFAALTITFTLHSLRMFIFFIKEFRSRQQVKVWVQLLLPWVSWIALLFWVGFLDWIFAYVLPLLIANCIVMAYISTNHRLNPLVAVNDPLANSLTVTVPKWVDVLHFNFSYHTEHHLFPGMNPKFYPLVKQQIKKMWPDRYHEMTLIKALRTLWKTPRVYHCENELFDPHRGAVYGTLGHGLNPDQVTPRIVELPKENEPLSLSAASPRTEP